jgi:hypothetical protein
MTCLCACLCMCARQIPRRQHASYPVRLHLHRTIPSGVTREVAVCRQYACPRSDGVFTLVFKVFQWQIKESVIGGEERGISHNLQAKVGRLSAPKPDQLFLQSYTR